jgi:hypothetical protein
MEGFFSACEDERDSVSPIHVSRIGIFFYSCVTSRELKKATDGDGRLFSTIEGEEKSSISG